MTFGQIEVQKIGRGANPLLPTIDRDVKSENIEMGENGISVTDSVACFFFLRHIQFSSVTFTKERTSQMNRVKKAIAEYDKEKAISEQSGLDERGTQFLESLDNGSWFTVGGRLGLLVNGGTSSCVVSYHGESGKFHIAPQTEVKVASRPNIEVKENVPVYLRKRWTEEEDRVLEKNVRDKDIKELMGILPNRSPYAIEGRIGTLRLNHIAKQPYWKE